MTSTHALNPARTGSPFQREATRRAKSGAILLIGAALFLIALLGEAAFIAMSAPSIAEFGTIYFSVT